VLESWTSSQVREAEQPLLAAGEPLMERAAFALHVHVCSALRDLRGRVGGATVLVLAGSGNNGGDALFAGALLARRGVEVRAVLASENAHEGGLAALLRAGGRVVDRPVVADLVLDGLVGIGGDGAGLRGRAAEIVDELVGDPFVVAVDVPSGIGVDDGTASGTGLDADLTVTFGGAKPGLLLPPAARRAGRVEVVDIGLRLGDNPAVVRLEDGDVAGLWPVPTADAHKYTRGVVGVVAGSRAYPGAAILATTAALRAGIGMVRYLGDVGERVVAANPEVVVGNGRVQGWVFGPGVSTDDASQRRRIQYALDHVLTGGEPAVIDAGALELLPEHVGPHAVLTPHAGELAALLTARGEDVDRAGIEAAPLRWARRTHELIGATVLLKGPVTLVVGAHGATYAQADAPAWLATAGAGDVLAGLLGALLAARVEAIHEDPTIVAALAATAALVHGRAAHRANPGGPISASAVAEALPGTVADLVGRP